MIIKSCLTDGLMVDLGREAVRPAERLWETTTAEYLRRRPGFIRRHFADSNSWLFDQRLPPNKALQLPDG